MKKIKRRFLIVFSVILMCGIFQQLYYRIEYEGNLVFYIANESLADPAQLEIFVDGIKIIDDKINSVFHLDKQYSAKMNGELTEEIKLNTFLVTFVAVEYYGDRLDIPGEYRKHFYISIEKCPMHFIA